MPAKLNGISVFFPAYNEQGHIATTVKRAKDILPKIAKDWEILVVNDGSKDKTGKIIDKLAKKSSKVKAIHHDVNRGYGAAFKSGLYAGKYEWITFTDSDGQFDFSEITNFIEEQRKTKADIVIGYYKKRRVSKTKILTSKMWELVVFALFGLKVHDIDCGFKLISKKVVDEIPDLESERGAFISSEFLIKAKKRGFKIVEIPVTHYPRTAGQGTGRDIKVILNSFMDLFRLWFKLR
jgi:glycosyltransferase involved in cell wall biosynthesis